MNNRNYEIKVRLTQAEMVHLNRLVNGSKLSREAYLRQLIAGVVPQDAPPPDYFSMMQQLYRIGNNLNQMALKARGLGAIDASHSDEAVQEFREAVQTIQAAVLLPRQAAR